MLYNTPVPDIGGIMAADRAFRLSCTVQRRRSSSATLHKFAVFFCLFSFLLTSCENKSSQEGSNEPVAVPKNALELVLTYGSEKEKWINEVTNKFNQEDHRTAGGKRIFVRTVAMGS